MMDIKASLPDEVAYPKLADLTVDSTVGDLLLHQASLSISALGKELMHLFTDDPVLPGVLLINDDDFVGMISRQRFLAQMSRPYSLELFLERPLQILHPFIQSEPLIVLAEMPIVEAAQHSLHRPTHLLYEPLVVKRESGHYSILDIHQLLIAQAEIHRLTTTLLHERTQAHLAQSEKMSSLGRMIAGVSHEIKNPVNCISGNFEFLNQYITDLTTLVKAYRRFYGQLPIDGVLQEPRSPEAQDFTSNSVHVESGQRSAAQHHNYQQHAREAIAQLEEEIDLDFLLTDLPKLMQSVNLAAERMVEIVSSLRNFSRMDQERPQLIDIHKYIDGTLLILNNRLKSGIELIKDYEDVPLIQCFPGQISQVFMNLISNGVDALLEKQENQKRLHVEPQPIVTADTISTLEHGTGRLPLWQPQIRITTHFLKGEDQDFLQIKIWDNGEGIPPQLQDRVFDAFFTTKSTDQGNGLGLAISYQIVTQKHGGHIHLMSSPDRGTEFEILLPYGQQGKG